MTDWVYPGPWVTSEMMADAIRVVNLFVALILIVIAGVMIGRDMADLDYQRAKGVNGIRRIQGHINRRTHINRLLLGLAFLITSMLALTDLDLFVLIWVNRMVFISVLLSFTAASVKDWFDERKQMEYLVEEEARAKRIALARGDGFSERAGVIGARVLASSPEPVDVGDGGPLSP